MCGATRSATKVPATSGSRLGNWPTFKQDNDGNGTWELDQSRVHNAVNELTEFTTTTWVDPQHDAAGNMTTMPQPNSPTDEYTATYDAWNRLVLVSAGADVAAMEYDGLGRRISRLDPYPNWETTHYYYNDKWQVLTEAKDGTAEAIYAWHLYYIDALAVRFRAGDQHYFLHDANFNVTAAYDVNPSSGTYRQVVERYRYTPYGEVTFLNADFSKKTVQESAIGNNYLYTGRERDPETGLQLNRNRYYHAGLGRWLTQDPIGYEGSEWNLYEYGRSNPSRNSDPWGLWNLNPGGHLPPIRPRPGPPVPPPIPPNPGVPPGPGWNWQEPGGAWVKPDFPHGQSLHPDLDHKPPKRPHWGWTDQFGNQWEFYPDTGKWKPVPGNNPNKPQPLFPEGTLEVVATGMTVGVVIYLIISQGSRILCPPRNLVPIP